MPVALAGLVAAAPGDAPRDALTVLVSDPSGARGTPSSSYELRCEPVGGTHPEAAAACDRLDGFGRGGSDPFAPVPEGQLCTQIYGGPATARVVGTWHGRPVDASFNRRNGCEISRWRQLVPVLPDLG
ncbi:SSI family serine proteinase inhibitor [Streptomyces sp. NPDC047002]|uniref:SSI family serine proteinase inhibitor n=1 Tax=Streptomyces sp. NPDC047002 TaxID=3155475 RepID=UPI003452845F